MSETAEKVEPKKLPILIDKYIGTVMSILANGLGLLVKPLFPDIIIATSVWLAFELSGHGKNWPVKFLSPIRIAILWGLATFLSLARISALSLVWKPSIDVLGGISFVSAGMFFIGLLVTFYLPLSEPWRRSNQRAIVAHTATCFCFKQEPNDFFSVILIYNENFSWWLPPGGHVALFEGSLPEIVAEEKCRVEAGVEITTWCGNTEVRPTSVGCTKHRSAPLLYSLQVPETATCAKSKHHRIHFDHCFVAKVEKATTDPMYKTLEIRIKSSNTFPELEEKLRGAIRGIHQDPQKAYPDDLPQRLFDAVQVLREDARQLAVTHVKETQDA